MRVAVTSELRYTSAPSLPPRLPLFSSFLSTHPFPPISFHSPSNFPSSIVHSKPFFFISNHLFPCLLFSFLVFLFQFPSPHSAPPPLRHPFVFCFIRSFLAAPLPPLLPPWRQLLTLTAPPSVFPSSMGLSVDVPRPHLVT